MIHENSIYKLYIIYIQLYIHKYTNYNIIEIYINRLRDCSYGGELARLGGMAHLGEIPPSLRNSYKNIMCSYEK